MGKKKKINKIRFISSLSILIGFTILAVLLGITLADFLHTDAEFTDQVCFEDNCFFVELAITPEEKAHGLMFKGYLDDDYGMLFVFNESGYHTFWMKNMIIHLDIIWLNEDREIVHIERNAEPCKDICKILDASAESKYVLEIKSGLSDKLGLENGMRADFFIAPYE